MESIAVQSLEYNNGIWIVASDGASPIASAKIWISKDDGLTFERLDFTKKTILNQDGSDYGFNSKFTKLGCQTINIINGKFFINLAWNSKNKEGIILYSDDMEIFYVSDFTRRELPEFRKSKEDRVQFVWKFSGNNDIILGGTYRGGLVISKDGGKSFNPINSGLSALDSGDIKGITYGNGTYVVASKNWYNWDEENKKVINSTDYTNSGLFYSKDGENWKWVGEIFDANGKVINKFYDVLFYDGLFIACATGSGDYTGGIVYSEDGINWNYLTSGEYKTLWEYLSLVYSCDITIGNNRIIEFKIGNYKYWRTRNHCLDKNEMIITNIDELCLVVKELAKAQGLKVNIDIEK